MTQKQQLYIGYFIMWLLIVVFTLGITYHALGTLPVAISIFVAVLVGIMTSGSFFILRPDTDKSLKEAEQYGKAVTALGATPEGNRMRIIHIVIGISFLTVVAVLFFTAEGATTLRRILFYLGLFLGGSMFFTQRKLNQIMEKAIPESRAYAQMQQELMWRWPITRLTLKIIIFAVVLAIALSALIFLVLLLV